MNRLGVPAHIYGYKYIAEALQLIIEDPGNIKSMTKTIILDKILIPFTMAPEFKEAIDNNQRIAICIVVADGDRQNQKRVQAANVVHNVENNKTRTARMAQYLFK